jgi:hypothetical protein
VALRLRGYEITHIDVYNQVKEAVEYGNKIGIRMAFELDPRVARRSFELKYPNELQGMIKVVETDLKANTPVEIVVKSSDIGDHMTGGSGLRYIPLRSGILRVYAYDRTPGGIEPSSISDITQECRLEYASKDSLAVTLPARNNGKAAVMASFTHLYPDVWSPHIIEFQRDLMRMYSDIPMAGVMRDEWGFPPTPMPFETNFWYTKPMAEAYAERTGGRELLADYLLMTFGIKGRESERIMAINTLLEMNRERNGLLEDDFYKAVKEYFGHDAAVVTHPTWYAYACIREYRKNGMNWWIATRDWAQTDEYAPYGARTSLAKRWGSAVNYNQFYAGKREDYKHQLWATAITGGRLNYHPMHSATPLKPGVNRNLDLMREGLMLGESRVSLLNFICTTPLNCPVAVIFGHACTMNWAGPHYDDIGMDLTESLWCQGIPADIIPSSEIWNGRLKMDGEGYICYGPQRYAAIVLYHPEFEKIQTAEFFSGSAKTKTRMFRIGDWKQDFNGRLFDGNSALPSTMSGYTEIKPVISEVNKIMKKNKIPSITPSYKTGNDNRPGITNPETGFCRLIDGTLIQIAGTNNAGGDPIVSTRKVDGFNVSFDAVGVAAVRVDREGKVQALAAGGLKYFKLGRFIISLEERADLALWINKDGEWEGVLQGWNGDIPAQLLELTSNWLRLKATVPVPD